MPPVYSSIKVVNSYDGSTEITNPNINIIYKPSVIPLDICDQIYDLLDSIKTPLKYHTYKGNFARTISPKRCTYSLVPHRNFYRYKGKDLRVFKQPVLESVMELIKPYIDPNFEYDAVIFNGYAYNNTDYISVHVDDEKFLKKGNFKSMDESVVCTITILKNPYKQMKYNCANPKFSNEGISILTGNGSFIYQGSILHEIKKTNEIEPTDEIGRFSITLRKLIDTCEHGHNCKYISCPYNYGPSNYVYYNNYDKFRS